MLSNMRLRYRIPLAVIAILMVLTLSVGSSYALWIVNRSQSTSNIIKTGCFEISFVNDTSSINLQNAYPVTDEKGKESTPYKFTVTNTCTIAADYTIYLNTLNLTNGKTKIGDNYIKYSISKMNGDSEATTITKLLGNPSMSEEEKKKLIDNKTLFNEDGFNAVETFEKSYEIASGTLSASSTKGGTGGSATYTLRLWIDRDATTAINNQYFEAAVYSIARSTSRK